MSDRTVQRRSRSHYKDRSTSNRRSEDRRSRTSTDRYEDRPSINRSQRDKSRSPVRRSGDRRSPVRRSGDRRSPVRRSGDRGHDRDRRASTERYKDRDRATKSENSVKKDPDSEALAAQKKAERLARMRAKMGKEGVPVSNGDAAPVVNAVGNGMTIRVKGEGIAPSVSLGHGMDSTDTQDNALLREFDREVIPYLPDSDTPVLLPPPSLTLDGVVVHPIARCDDIDPLDAYMQDVYGIVKACEDHEAQDHDQEDERFEDDTAERDNRVRREDSDSFEPILEEEEEDEMSYFGLLKKGVVHKKELGEVDHGAINYNEIKKNIYVQVREISQMTDIEVEALRKTNSDIRIRGKHVPRPVFSFSQIGLPDALLDKLRRRGCEKPFPIQMQAIPMLLCGRDCLAIAETGSGKTLAYTLPLIRHVRAQPPVEPNEGFVGLIIAPTRELAVQIYQEVHRYAKLVNMRVVAAYGGGGIGEQLGKLRRGCEIVVGTPGRLIDVLTISNSKVTNLRRVSFLVIDEADRMFDMGFAPQIEQIISNIRPDRQIALFSATFPRSIESLAKQILNKPVEVVCGTGRGAASSHIVQYVEVRPESERIIRLLQLLGEWTPHGSVIVFVNRHDECDELFLLLQKYGHECLVLHGGLDQGDREWAVQDFKDRKKPILVATSIAARGLDVRHCVLVVNYFPPDHLEDYVHRVGRAGRAGGVGSAYTFISVEEEDRAEDLRRALMTAKMNVPQELDDIVEGFREKVKAGDAKRRGPRRGYGGHGFTFKEKSDQQKALEDARKQMGHGKTPEEDEYNIDEDGMIVMATPAPTATVDDGPVVVAPPPTVSAAAAAALSSLGLKTTMVHDLKKKEKPKPAEPVPKNHDALGPNGYVDPNTGNFVDEMPVNDYPPQARHRISTKESIGRISEATGAILQVKGQYVDPEWAKQNATHASSMMLKPLYVEIIAPSVVSLVTAKHEIKKLVESVAIAQLNLDPKTAAQFVRSGGRLKL